MGKKWKQWQILFSWAPKSLWTVTAAMKLKMLAPWKKSNVKPAAATAKSLQSCLTLCDPIDGSPPGSPVPGILQARTLEWVAISFSNAWKGNVKVKALSRVQLIATPWTVAHQTSPSMGFSWKEDWSRAPLPSPLFPYWCTTSGFCDASLNGFYQYIISADFRQKSFMTYFMREKQD